MYHSFPYSIEFSPVLIPDDNLQGIYEPERCEEVDDLQEAIRESIENPIFSDKLENIARGKKNAVIVSDDYTRHTPVKQIIPILIEKLNSVGIYDIKILVALGTHRPMTVEEKKQKFGKKIFDKYEIINHEYNNHLELRDMGYTSYGSRFYINRRAVETELLIGLGQIVPHRIAGYSGGSKIILPGIAGAECISKTHWDGGIMPTEKILGEVENPIRSEMNECARIVDLAFIVNAVCDPSGRVIGIFSGHYKKAHEKGAKLAEKVFGAYFLYKSDIVIVDSYPKDIELWQAAKALYAAELMVKDGGVIVLVSPCKEGVSKAHPQISEYGYRTEEETMADIENGTLSNLSVASHCLRVGRIIKDKCRCIMVQNGISERQAERMGFIHAKTPQEALDIAFYLRGNYATVSVLKNGGEVLPVCVLKE